MPIQIRLKFSLFLLTSHLSLCMHTFSFSFSLCPPLLTQSVCQSLWLSLSLSDLFTVMTCIIFPFPLYLLICVIFPDFPLDLPSTAHLLNLSFSFYPLPCALFFFLLDLSHSFSYCRPSHSLMSYFFSLSLSLSQIFPLQTIFLMYPSLVSPTSLSISFLSFPLLMFSH